MKDVKVDKHLGNDDSVSPLNKLEQRIFENIKKSMEEIRAHQRGEIKLRDARELLNEL
ncbi:hypothetical protein [Mucilaginibacter pedocola]|uniref:hypothetical protein n=1 Tax=Mucilaginibacter pedocola TaxID=1792845 RepID=UPI0012DDF282|nr:hypothetical protein [Mucilaginibacter pedocola]